MTSDLSTLAGVQQAVVAAATAAATTLPLAAVVDAPLEEGSMDGLLPPDGPWRAVTLNVRGAAVGTLVLVVGANLASALENGPFGAQELVAALGPALADAGSALEQVVDAPLLVEAAHEVQAAIAFAGVSEGSLFGAVPLSTGGEHVATLARLLEQVPAVDATVPQPRGVERTTDGPQAHEFQPLTGAGGPTASARSMDLLHDVEMGVTAELGRTRMTVRDLLSLTPGAVVELDRAAGSPVDVLVNGTLIARGEVVVIDEEFGIRISEIIGTRLADAATRR